MTAWRALLENLAGLPYGGEAVDQLTHALQCAQQAAESGADDEVVAAAALHDIGRAPSVAGRHPGIAHEEAGAEFCRPLLGSGWRGSSAPTCRASATSWPPSPPTATG